MALVGIEALKENPQDTDLFVATWEEFVQAYESEERQASKPMLSELAKIALLDEPTRILVDAAELVIRDGPRWWGNRDNSPDTGSTCWNEGFLAEPTAKDYREVCIRPPHRPSLENQDLSVLPAVTFSGRVYGARDWGHHNLYLLPRDGRVDPIVTRMIYDDLRQEMSRIAGYALEAA